MIDMKMSKKMKNMIILQTILIILGVLLILAIEFGWIYQIPDCNIKEKFGFVCPTCGITRCAISLIKFQFIESFLYHPTFFIFVFYAGIVDFIYIINTIFNKTYFKFLYPSIPILCIGLIQFVLQYILRLSGMI